jgi:hypothetical protein
MNLVPQFSHDKKIEDERFVLQKKFGNHPKRIELFPEGTYYPKAKETGFLKLSMAKNGMLGWGKWVE